MNVRPPADDAEVSALARVLASSFTFSAEDAKGWIAAAQPENARVLADGDTIVAGLITLPMGQFFGGRRVPMGGLAAVGVLPEARGRGAATLLVRATLTDLRRRGLAISALYPSTLALYRNLGWEVAGSRWEVRLDPQKIAVRDRALLLRKAGVDDVIGIRAAHLVRARYTPGAIDRHAFLWDRVLAPRGQDASGYVVGEDRVDGYLFFAREARERGHFDLNVTDLVALDAGAARRILAFLADMGTLCDRVVWRGPADDALLAALPERHAAIRQLDPWMLRIVDVPAALEARGWPEGFVGEVDLDVRDAEIPENHGRFVVAWADGQVHVRRGGQGRLRLDVRGLAALYTGHKSPQQLAAAGIVEGDDRALALAAAAFAGPAPTMSDGF